VIELPFPEAEQGSKKSGSFDYDPNKTGFSYAEYPKAGITVRDSGYISEMENDRDAGIDVFAENKKYIEKLEREKQLKQASLKQEEIEYEPTMKYVGQIFATYLIFEYGNEIYLIDQHAAHERLLYDDLLKKAGEGENMSQPLLVPYTFNAVGEDFINIYNRFEYFRQLGFDIVNVGDYSFQISAIPCLLSNINLKEFFDDILFDNAFKRETVPLILKEKLMQKACKHAIKAGDVLSPSDIDALMAKLKGDLGLRCPHGRPIAVKITKTEIEKWFKRIV
jgi:DNA mismatch repair protein MutL